MKHMTPGTVRLYEAVEAVDGLPQEITNVEAEAHGLADELQRAIDNEQYQPIYEITMIGVEVIKHGSANI